GFGIEPASLLSSHGTAVRYGRESVLLFTRDLPLLGDLLGRHAHAVGDAHVLVQVDDLGVERRLGAAHGHHGHRFHTTGDHDFGFTDADAVGGHRHGGDTGRAKAVHGGSSHGLGQARQQRGDLGHVHALLAFGHG